ncbi:MAG TPA: phosphoribosylanthranilate isomerase [Bacteroidia bacterium]|nr:phosphoribosylanthranilate isomerase [Bacteroidia bacterium]
MKRVKIKFCGMRAKDSLVYAIDLGVDYLGFVLDYPKSPRSISMSQFLRTAEWLKKNKKGKYKIVAVTVDMPVKKIQQIIESDFVDVIQLHGNESVELIKKIRGIEVWKAWNNKSKGDVLEMSKHVDRILLDSGNATEKALNRSHEFDGFALYEKLATKKVGLILSGGIDSKNVSMYMDKLSPEIIDVSRGIETLPGKKSKKKMKEFVETVNDYYKR